MAHNNTLFHSMLNFIPRHQFDALENQHGTGRKARDFTRWNQFVHLMFMQLTGRSSLRDGIQSMNSRFNNLYHLGAKPVAKSTFADANAMRPASLYEALFEKTYQRCRMISPKHKFKFKNELYSLDATVIDLSIGAFPWASFRRTKSAIKVHTLMNHSGYLPAFVSITDGKKHESKVASSIKLPKGSIVAEDRAYTDYAWFAQLQQNGIFFVTRQKTNAVYKVIERRSVNKKQGLCSDQTITLSGTKGHLCPHSLRRVGYPLSKQQLVRLDRQGNVLSTIGPSLTGTQIGAVALSKDQTRVAIDAFERQFEDIWLVDTSRGTHARLTFAPCRDAEATFSADSLQVAFTSEREGTSDIYVQALDPQAQALVKGSVDKFNAHWSQNGAYLAYEMLDVKTKRDIWYLPMTP